MERELDKYGIQSWKWYCHSHPGGSGQGFQLDDDNAMWFYEESRKRGMKRFSVHKGYSYHSRTLGHLANPKDVEKAALNNKDPTFIVYHSALEHGPGEPEFKDPKWYDPKTGDFGWHDVPMDIKIRNPHMNNVYCEIGSFFNVLAIADPRKITPEDKAKIFGLNAAKIYEVNVKDKRNPPPDDTLDKLRSAYLDHGGMRSNQVYG